MKEDKDRKLILMQCRVTAEVADRVDRIIKRCGIGSRYELMGYLLSCFLKYADPQSDSDRTADVREIGRIFEGYDDPTTRLVTVSTSTGMIVSDTVRYMTQRGKKAHTAVMYDHLHGWETSNSLDILDTTLDRLFPSLANRIKDIGRATGARYAKEVLDQLTEQAAGIDEAWHTISTDMERFENNIQYGIVPKRARSYVTSDEQNTTNTDDYEPQPDI